MNQRLARFSREHRPTVKLAATYLAVIMAMSIIFSLILYVTSIHGLEKRPPHPQFSTEQRDPDHEIDEWLGRRAADNRNELALRLIILNIATFLGGAWLSYFLARRTLQPIEKAMGEQDRFVADASHELRTPLTSILLSNEVTLRKKDLKISDAKKLIKQNVEDIKELIILSNELLDISIDTQVAHIQKQQLNPIIKDAIKKVEPLAAAKDIKIIVKNSVNHIVTDRKMLGDSMAILLDNAIKYSPKKTKITIVSRSLGNSIVIAVIDKGIGIAEADMSHIFERFYRVDESRSQTTGHGLGLSIAAKLAAKIGAELEVKSSLGTGSTFTIKLSE